MISMDNLFDMVCTEVHWPVSDGIWFVQRPIYFDPMSPQEVLKLWRLGQVSDALKAKALRMLDRQSNVRRRKRWKELKERKRA